MKVLLLDLAHARSGDKGNTSNIGVIARKPEFYPLLKKNLTAERVKKHFAGITFGSVERFELPNLGALNFVLPFILESGGSTSLRIDAQGKAMGQAILEMMIDVPESGDPTA